MVSSFKVKWDLLTDIDILLMVERRIRGGTCHSIYRYVKANNKYMKTYDKIKKSSILGCKLFIWLGNDAKASRK